jgi:predicted HicB family RNase H-like nuclease
MKTKTVTLMLDIVPSVKLEAAAKRNKKSVNDFIISFFERKVHCTHKSKKNSV